MTVDAEIEKLFETHTIEEIQKEQSKIRTNIEKKKEDLRIMVGERYRDLIEAADTIQQMESSCAGVCDQVSTVQKLCSNLQHRGLIGFRTTPQQLQKSLGIDNNNEKLQRTAAQVKVVVMASTRVWSLMERGELLAATQLFLLTQHTHTALMLSHGANKVDVSEQFPVLCRHWASVCQLPISISRLCHHTIVAATDLNSLPPQHTQRVVEAVVSLLLLHSGSVTAVLQKVLQVLQDSLMQSLLSYTPDKTARPLVTEFASRLLDALTLLHTVFVKDKSTVDGVSAVEASIAWVVTSNTAATSSLSTTAASPPPVTLLQETDAFRSLLPSAILNYRPRVGVHSSGVEVLRLKDDELPNAINSWLTAVVDTAKLHLHRILGYCPSVQSMCVVRDSVWAALDKRSLQHRAKVTLELGLGEWCVWQRVVRDCVHHRAMQIIRQQLNSAGTSTLQDITQLVNSIRRNNKVAYEEGSGVVQFVWSEAAGDLPDKVGWLSAAQRTIQQAGGLAYKSYGYTGRTQTICASLDCQLSELRQDLEHMRSIENDEQAGARQDYEELLRLLQEQSDAVFSSLITGIEAVLEEMLLETGRQRSSSSCGGASDVVTADDALDDVWDDSLVTSSSWLSMDDRTLLKPHQTALVSLARICHALINICPNMQLCALATALVNPDTVRRVNLGLHIDSNSGVWKSVQHKLETAIKKFLQQFLSTLTAALAAAITKGLLLPLQQDTTVAMLSSLAMCDTVEVCEEAAEGEEKVVSKLAVPSQPSPALYSALNTLCRSLNAATLHTLSRSFSSTVAGAVSRSIMSVYSKVVSCAANSSNQQLALHLLFDLKFVANTILPSDEADKDTAQQLSSLQQQLEGCVDPFDLSVFQTHINTRVRAAANRSQVLLGAVFVRERQHPACKTASGGSNASAVLPLIPVVDIPRFSNVPLPKTSSLASSNITALVEGFSIDQSSVSATLGHALHHQSLNKMDVTGGSKDLSQGPVLSNNLSTQYSSSVASSSSLTASLPAGARSASAIFSAMSSSWFGGSSNK